MKELIWSGSNMTMGRLAFVLVVAFAVLIGFSFGSAFSDWKAARLPADCDCYDETVQ